jgi:hypothetical protein
MVVNVSHEEVELPKSPVLDVEEEVSETLVADVNDGPLSQTRKRTARVKIDASF